MASYVVMEPPARGEAETAVLVRDGFHFLAFLLPAIWLLWHRLWLEALAVILVSIALGVAGSFAGFGNAAPVLSLLVGVFIGLEAASIRLAALRRRGWNEWGVVEADSYSDAEIRYLSEAVVEEEEPAPEPDEIHPIFGRRDYYRAPPSGPALGMLGYTARS